MVMIGDVWELLIGRTQGPLKMRLILQPSVAVLLALRAGIQDARAGRPPYFWAMLSDPALRRELIRSGWKDVSKVFVLATLLDCVYQWLVTHAIHPLQAIRIAIVLAIVPYLVVRGPVSRIARRLMGPPAPRP